MSEDKTIEHLLEQISTISKKYKDIAKITGENFNIFHVLNMASSEVGLHSRLIGELLSPKGSHDQGTLFLQIFIEECGLLEIVDGTDLDLTTIVIEEYIGPISEDYEIGGRIDLVLKFNNGKVIVIENKIYARDQEKQLKRYKNAYPNAKIVYLNLGGKDENTKIVGGLNTEDFTWISYRNEILNWLKKSAKEAYGLPNIQYILDHYIKVVNYLTNQNSNNKMKEEIIEKILSSDGNYQSAIEISNEIVAIQNVFFNADLIEESWKKKLNIDRRELILFGTTNDSYQMRPSIEGGKIVFHIFSVNKWSDAKNTIHYPFLEMISKLYPYNQPNANYIGYITSARYNLSDLSFDEIRKYVLNNNMITWADNIADEGIEIVKNMYNYLLTCDFKNDIVFTNDLLKII